MVKVILNSQKVKYAALVFERGCILIQWFFGEIINHRMVLSEIGMIVQMEWEKSFAICTELFCDVSVIMPNHIHAILRIENKNNTTGGQIGVRDQNGSGDNVETHDHASLQWQNHYKIHISVYET